MVARAGEAPEVVLEATYGWYWAADVLAESGASVHLAHPLGNNWGNRRVKNDERDATDLIDMLRLGRLAEAYIAPPGLRELRELVRHRAKLVAIRVRAQSPSPRRSGQRGREGAGHQPVRGRRTQSCSTTWPWATPTGYGSIRCCGLIDAFDDEIEVFAAVVAEILEDHAGYHAIQAIPGVGPVLAAIFVAEIGDVARFGGAAPVVFVVGAHPTPPRVRHPRVSRAYHQTRLPAGALGRGRGRAAANVAPPLSPRTITVSPSGEANPSAGSPAARKVLTLVYYGLRDGDIRCLAQTG